jgi:hypothetical protein
MDSMTQYYNIQHLKDIIVVCKVTIPKEDDPCDDVTHWAGKKIIKTTP